MQKLLGHYYSPRGNNNPIDQGFSYQSYNQPGTKTTHQNSYGFGRLQTEDTLDRFQKEQSLNKSNNNQSYHNSPTEPFSPQQNNSHFSPLPNNSSNLYTNQISTHNETTQSPTHFNQSPEVRSNPVETQKPSSNIFQETRSPGLSNSSVTLRPNPLYTKSFDQTNKYETNTPEQLNKLKFDIIKNQRSLEQRIEESMKKRPYNILTNQGSSSGSGSSVYQGMPYGYALKALLKNQEDAKIQKATAVNGVEYDSPLRSTKKFGSESYRPQNYQEALRNQYKGPYDAGKNNYYGETEFRYANKPQIQEPLNQEQLYGIRALKNLSGMKLY